MSSVPAKDVEKLSEMSGVELAAGGSDEKADDRMQGLGALIGHATGLAIGTAGPREWSAKSWAMETVPHLAYGAVAVAGYEAFGD